ncbi:MAG: tetratricopeptide repeat protein [Bryobacteraceae bacterium]
MTSGRIRRSLLLLFLNGSLAAQQTLEHAWDLAARGQRQDAIRLLQDLVHLAPGNADVRLLLGSLLMEGGDRTGSIDQLQAATRLRPKSAEAENALGEAYDKFGDSAGAREAFRLAVSFDPRFGIAQLNLGQALLAAGDVKLASEHLDRAIELLGRTDDAASGHYLRARAYTANGNAQHAEEHLREAVKIRPEFAEAWSDLGQARKSLLDIPGALDAFETAVRLNPEDPVAQYRFGAECLRQGKAHVAVEHLEKAYSLNPADQSTLNSLQMALRRDGKADRANLLKQRLADLLRDKDQVDRNHLTAIRLNNEGAKLEAAKDLRGALEKYRQAVNLYPEMVGIRANFAVVLLRLGQWTEGLRELHEASLRDPGDARIKAALKDALAQAPVNLKPEGSREVR